MNDTMSLDERATLKCYLHLARLSEMMLQAAGRSDWEDVSGMERRAQVVVDELKLLSASEKPHPNTDFRSEKMRLIKVILALDAQIRDLAQPRLAQLEGAMYAPRNARRLSAAYGCGRFD